MHWLWHTLAIAFAAVCGFAFGYALGMDAKRFKRDK